MKLIINSPSLNPKENVSGISSVTQFIISNNKQVNYIHFEVGRRDAESKGVLSRLKRIKRNKTEWYELLSENRDAVIHYNMPLMKAAIIRDYMMLKVAHKFNMPIVLHVHGGNYIKERNRPWYLRNLLSKMFSWSKHIIVLGEEEKSIIENDFHLDNVIPLPNCIDLSEAKSYAREVTNKKKLDILYLGRIEFNKGIEYILDAAKQLKVAHVPFTLHFAGKEETEGEYIPRFQSELGNAFIYHGVVFGQMKIELLKQCDIFLLPSFFEGLPMSLIETMSFGMVPVVTPVGSIPSVIDNKNNGMFINVRNSEDIAKAITTLTYDKTMITKLSFNAKRTILRKFDDVQYIDKLNQLYNEVEDSMPTKTT